MRDGPPGHGSLIAGLAARLGRRRRVRRPASGAGDGRRWTAHRRARRRRRRRRRCPRHRSRPEAGRPPGALAAVGGVLRHRALREPERPGLAAGDRAPAGVARERARRPGLARGPARRRRRRGRMPGRERAGGDAALAPGHTRPTLKRGAVRADRPPVPDQPGHRAAALRRPAADRRRGAGQGLGRRGRADAGQGPLGPRRSTSPSTTSATTAAARTSTRAS